MLLVGSTALRHHFKDFPRFCYDRDFITTYEEACDIIKGDIAVFGPEYVCKPSSSKKLILTRIFLTCREIYEFELAWPGGTAEKILSLENGIASPELLLMLKLSHRFLKNSPHFLKTMEDIHFLRAKGVVLTPKYQELLKEREAETYSYSHPKLNVKKQDFFTKNVKYVYDHDDIHKAITFLEEPAYLSFKKPDSEVMCDRDLFNLARHKTKIGAVYEEACVLALERSLIPFPGKLTPGQAFEKALEKVCTSITSGWFRDYAWENYHEVLEMFNYTLKYYTYWDMFVNAKALGRIKRL